MTSACENNSTMVITETNKKITSPNWPSPYPSNSECVWNIMAAQGARIQLKVKGHSLDER